MKISAYLGVANAETVRSASGVIVRLQDDD
jgi:hypothetical protein